MTPTLLEIHPLATTNAVLNALSTVLLVVGWIAIRQRNWRAHRAAMVAAFLVSTVFLVCYLAYHWIVGHVPFTGQGPVRAVYFVILISHILLAGTVPFLALRMFFLAFRGRLDAHRRWGGSPCRSGSTSASPVSSSTPCSTTSIPRSMFPRPSDPGRARTGSLPETQPVASRLSIECPTAGRGGCRPRKPTTFSPGDQVESPPGDQVEKGQR